MYKVKYYDCEFALCKAEWFNSKEDAVDFAFDRVYCCNYDKATVYDANGCEILTYRNDY